MDLTVETRLGKALDEIPGALEYVVGLNPHDFSRLRNPIMRKYMAPRITLGRIAAMVKMAPDRLLTDLADLSGGMSRAILPTMAVEKPQSPAEAPAWLAEAEARGLHHVDVLRIDAVLGDPLPPINAGIKRLAPGGVLVIHHLWEPQPLYDVWSKMGLAWFARPAADDTWDIFVHRPPGATMTGGPASPTVDLRHLPATERAPRLIAMFEQVRAGESLDVWADDAPWLAEVRAALETAHGGAFTWDEQAGSDRLAIRLVRTGPASA